MVVSTQLSGYRQPAHKPGTHKPLNPCGICIAETLASEAKFQLAGSTGGHGKPGIGTDDRIVRRRDRHKNDFAVAQGAIGISDANPKFFSRALGLHKVLAPSRLNSAKLRSRLSLPDEKIPLYGNAIQTPPPTSSTAATTPANR
ncbi:hypothetical protein [Variovorax sp. E3]|uniref:hypothetical protein n=1 Tax=Variovorax sp. E3 TaxID=1914993 RepID=UPI0018DDC243|nr:hypothetical protein [Variovorax sp. E3]